MWKSGGDEHFPLDTAVRLRVRLGLIRGESRLRKIGLRRRLDGMEREGIGVHNGRVEERGMMMRKATLGSLGLEWGWVEAMRGEVETEMKVWTDIGSRGEIQALGTTICPKP